MYTVSFLVLLFCETGDQCQNYKIQDRGELFFFVILPFVPAHHQTRFRSLLYSFFVSLLSEYRLGVRYFFSFWSLYYFPTFHVIQGVHFLIYYCFSLGSLRTVSRIRSFGIIITVCIAQFIVC